MYGYFKNAFFKFSIVLDAKNTCIIFLRYLLHGLFMLACEKFGNLVKEFLLYKSKENNETFFYYKKK
jgi:hypothetical protein